jgi:ATP-dependent Clp protease ATP-binding subunit ClpX
VEYRCSFCGKTEDQVKRLIAGQHAFICDECVALVHEVLTDTAFAGVSDQGRVTVGKQAEPRRLRRVWRRSRSD